MRHVSRSLDVGHQASGPAALPDLRDLMAWAISVLLGGLMLISRSWIGGGMSGGAGGAGRLSVSLKCTANLALCSVLSHLGWCFHPCP